MWIESHTTLVRHRKLMFLCSDLSIEKVTAIGHLHALWYAAIETQEDGDLSDWPDVMIADAAQWRGDPAVFVGALRAREFMDGGLLHDWLDYAGRYLQSKYRTANPKKLKAIYAKHKSVFSPTKVRLKSKVSASFSAKKQVGRYRSLNLKEREEGVGEEETKLPDFLDAELWESYRQHRAAMPKKHHMTANAERLAISQLSKWAESGQDPNEIVKRSIMNGWVGLFQVRNGNSSGAEPKGFNAVREFLKHENQR